MSRPRITWTDRSEPPSLPVLPETIELPATPRVCVDADAQARVLAHLVRHDTEAGGLLLGEVFGRRDDPSAVALVHVRAGVPAPEATGTAFSLRMESTLWRDAQAALAPGWRIIGWYHSHPGLGAFFSGTDRRTQRAFFAQPWSVGWVVDPIRGEEAWFIGPESDDLERIAVPGAEGDAGTDGGDETGQSNA